LGDPAAAQGKQPEEKMGVKAAEVKPQRDAQSGGERTHEEL
jgi:hypothetical protein